MDQDGNARQTLMDELLRAVGGTPRAAGEGLSDYLSGECWPGGSDDRLQRAAVEWLRRWSPGRTFAALPDCSCVHGRCAVCN